MVLISLWSQEVRSQKSVDLCDHLENRRDSLPSASVHEIWAATVQVVKNLSQGQTRAGRKRIYYVATVFEKSINTFMLLIYFIY